MKGLRLFLSLLAILPLILMTQAFSETSQEPPAGVAVMDWVPISDNLGLALRNVRMTFEVPGQTPDPSRTPEEEKVIDELRRRFIAGEADGEFFARVDGRWVRVITGAPSLRLLK